MTAKTAARRARGKKVRIKFEESDGTFGNYPEDCNATTIDYDYDSGLAATIQVTLKLPKRGIKTPEQLAQAIEHALETGEGVSFNVAVWRSTTEACDTEDED